MEAPTYLYDTNYGNPLIEGRKSNGKITEFKTGVQLGDFFHVEDLLDFSNEEIAGPIGEGTNNWPNCGTATATDSSTITMTETVSSNSSGDGNTTSRAYNPLETDENNPAELCVPCDDLAELEWLSNFVEDSFSVEEAPKGFLVPTFEDVRKDTEAQRPHKSAPCGNNSPLSVLDTTSSTITKAPSFSPETPVPGRARSKRSRPPCCNWSSRIVSPTSSASALENGPTSSALSSDSDFFAESSLATKKLMVKPSQVIQKRKEQEQQLPIRKCTHCATTKTPQWRTGPNGPKTLCNACGVRYKSGRLVPEYRPAASPTFMANKHSNSHRKVLEMRRQKEMAVLHGHPYVFEDDDEETERDSDHGDEDAAAQDHYPHPHARHRPPFFGCDDDTFLLHTAHDYRQLI